MKNQSGPMLDAGLSALDRRPGRARHARRNAGGGRRRVRPQPAEGRQHLRQRQQRRRPRPLAVLLHRASSPAPASSAATSTASPTRPAPPRWRTRSIPIELLATIYHAFGIDPETIVYNHLNQPRELVKAEAGDEAVRVAARPCGTSLDSGLPGSGGVRCSCRRAPAVFVVVAAGARRATIPPRGEADACSNAGRNNFPFSVRGQPAATEN